MRCGTEDVYTEMDTTANGGYCSSALKYDRVGRNIVANTMVGVDMSVGHTIATESPGGQPGRKSSTYLTSGALISSEVASVDG